MAARPLYKNPWIGIGVLLGALKGSRMRLPMIRDGSHTRAVIFCAIIGGFGGAGLEMLLTPYRGF